MERLMPHKPQYKHSDYSGVFLEKDRIKYAVPRICAVLRKHRFESIAVQGMSGATIGSIVAYELGKTICLVRKMNDPSHGVDHHRLLHPTASFFVEGDVAVKRYVILDDFISSGDTVLNIIESMKDFAPWARAIGMIEARGFQADCWDGWRYPNGKGNALLPICNPNGGLKHLHKDYVGVPAGLTPEEAVKPCAE